ncbi:MAG: MFS transporter [Alphaproteobacteria bacterium]|nr:MFS transporter [Alphaproteobacteria bacterium]
MSLPHPAGFHGIISVLRRRNGTVFFSGSMIAWTGMWVQRIAVGWLAWELTASYFWLGMIAFADMIPTVFVSPLAGAMADRVDRVRMTMATQLGSTCQAVALALMTYFEVMTIELLFAIEIVLGIIQCMAQPARQSLIPGIVPSGAIPSAVALNSLTFNIARFTGPALAGIIIKQWGIVPAFLVNAAAYFFASVSMVLLTIDPADRVGHAPSRSFLRETSEGLLYVFRHPGLGPLFAVLAATALLARPFMELLPGFADRVFGRGVDALASMTSSAGVGAFMGGLWMASRKSVRGLSFLAVHAALLIALMGMAFVATTYFPLALACCALLGAFIVVHSVAVQTLLQSNTERAMRGRALAVYGLTIRSCPAVGALTLGWISEGVGLRLPVAGGCALSLLVWAWGARRQRRMAAVLERGRGPKPSPPSPPSSQTPPKGTRTS